MASSFIYRVYSGKKVGQHSEIKLQNTFKYEYKDYCLNGKGYYVLEEDTVDGNCSWLYGGKRCEKYMRWI